MVVGGGGAARCLFLWDHSHGYFRHVADDMNWSNYTHEFSMICCESVLILGVVVMTGLNTAQA